VTATCGYCGHELVVVVDMSSVEQKLDRIIEQGVKIMSGQDQINADAQALQAFLADLNSAVNAIKTELSNAGTPVDTSALDALIGQLPGIQASVDSLAGTGSSAPTSGAPVDGSTPSADGSAPVDGSPVDGDGTTPVAA